MRWINWAKCVLVRHDWRLCAQAEWHTPSKQCERCGLFMDFMGRRYWGEQRPTITEEYYKSCLDAQGPREKVIQDGD